jgi:hypothetical protein
LLNLRRGRERVDRKKGFGQSPSGFHATHREGSTDLTPSVDQGTASTRIARFAILAHVYDGWNSCAASMLHNVAGGHFCMYI